VAVKETISGETLNMGCGGGGLLTVSVTVTVAGEPCAPTDVMVRCPV
jgi:hypothetical protein